VQALGHHQLGDNGIAKSPAQHLSVHRSPERGGDVEITHSAEQSLHEALAVLELLRREQVVDATTYIARRDEIGGSIARYGQYTMHFSELEHACRMAWRNSGTVPGA